MIKYVKPSVLRSRGAVRGAEKTWWKDKMKNKNV